jgi:hypothetical protein
MEPISRRRALQLGGLGVVTIVTGWVGLARTATSPFTPVTATAAAEPPALHSTNGVLQVQLVAALGAPGGAVGGVLLDLAGLGRGAEGVALVVVVAA